MADSQLTTPESGIYVIRCNVTGKVYVGSTSNFRKRKQVHWHYLFAGKHNNRHLQSAWKKYGSEVFVFEIIEHVLPDQLTERETYWIATFDATNHKRGFNISKLGTSCLGCKHSEESKARHSAAAKARILTEKDIERLRKMSADYAIQGASAETKAKMSLAGRGRKKSPEHVEKLAANLRGKPLSVETKAKLSVAHKGKRLTLEHRAKLSEVRRGKKRRRSPGTKETQNRLFD